MGTNANDRGQRRRRRLGAAIAGVAVVAVGGVALAAGMSSSSSGGLVRTAKNATLNRTVLVTSSGHTLYHLTAEHRGHFICNNMACLHIWHPLVVSSASKAKGAVPLTTIRRTDGRLQVAYKGGPLYTFTGDHAKGDAKGNGFKDVGTWLAATTSAAATATTAPPATTSGGGGYGNGY
jgi:predicted lipoprotein with Yx(FWY)xxD motif